MPPPKTRPIVDVVLLPGDETSQPRPTILEGHSARVGTPIWVLVDGTWQRFLVHRVVHSEIHVRRD